MNVAYWTSVNRLAAHQRTCGRPLFAAAIVGLGLMAGCSSYDGLPQPEDGAYEGPPIGAEVIANEHVLVAKLPAPGHEFTLDGTREAFQSQSVFVTLRRPNPAVLYPQVEVEQRLATGVPARFVVNVFVRIADFDEPDAPGHREALSIPAASPASR